MMTRAQKTLGTAKNWIFVCLLAAVAVWSVDSSTAGEIKNPDAIKSVLRSYSLLGEDGKPVALSRFTGEVVVINFWASWCKPCLREMPLLDELHTRMSRQGGRVLAVSVDHDPKRARRFIEQNNLTLPVYVDGTEGLAKKLDLAHLPYTIVLDSYGQVVFAGAGGAGPEWTKLTTLVEELLTQTGQRKAKEKLKS